MVDWFDTLPKRRRVDEAVRLELVTKQPHERLVLPELMVGHLLHRPHRVDKLSGPSPSPQQHHPGVQGHLAQPLVLNRV